MEEALDLSFDRLLMMMIIFLTCILDVSVVDFVMKRNEFKFLCGPSHRDERLVSFRLEIVIHAHNLSYFVQFLQII